MLHPVKRDLSADAAFDSVAELGDLVSSPLRSGDLPLLELSQNGLYLKSAEGRLLYANHALAEMLGYAPHELVGMEATSFIDDEDVATARDIMAETKWQPGECREMTVRLAGRSGAGRDAVIRFSKVRYHGRDAFIGSVRDVTDLRRCEKVLKDYAKRLRRLSQQVLDVQENERRNLARELHDEIGQQLTFIKLSLAKLSACNDALAHELAEPLAGISSLMEQVRAISLDLRPSMLDDLGMIAAIRWYVGRVAKLAGLDARMDLDPEFPRLLPEIETLFFRVAQEAVTNVMRHSRARRLEVRVAIADESVELRVTDDGIGFDPAKIREKAVHGAGAGLLGMQERAALAGACLDFDANDNGGACLRLAIPLARAMKPRRCD